MASSSCCASSAKAVVDYPSACGFLARPDGQIERIPVTWDTGAMVCMVDPSAVRPYWKKLSSSGRLLGVGNTLTDTQGEVEIPLSLVFQGTVLSVRAVITSLPAGVKLMVGLPLMHEIRALPDVVNCRVYCRGIHEVIRLDALRNILKRLESPPISVLSFFGGKSNGFSTFAHIEEKEND